MNRLVWIGIIVWGLLVTCFGLASAGTANGASAELQAHDLVFLITGGFLTCLVGVIGLTGVMGWIPLLRREQKSCV